MAFYYLFTVDAGYCGCDEDHLVIRDTPFATELDIARYCDYLSRENAEDCIDQCLTDEDQEDEEIVEEFYDVAMCLGHYSELTADEAQELIDQGYEVEEAMW